MCIRTCPSRRSKPKNKASKIINIWQLKEKDKWNKFFETTETRCMKTYLYRSCPSVNKQKGKIMSSARKWTMKHLNYNTRLHKIDKQEKGSTNSEYLYVGMWTNRMSHGTSILRFEKTNRS